MGSIERRAEDGDLAEEFLRRFLQLSVLGRSAAEVEQAGLEDHGQGDLVGGGRDASVHVIAEEDRRVVHRADGVPRERQDGIVPRSQAGECRLELVILGAANGFHAHQVRVGA